MRAVYPSRSGPLPETWELKVPAQELCLSQDGALGRCSWDLLEPIA